MKTLQEIRNELAAKVREQTPLAQKYVNGGLEGDELIRFRSLHAEIEALTGAKIDAERAEQEGAADRRAADEAIRLNGEYNVPAGRSLSGRVTGEDPSRRDEDEGGTVGERFVRSSQFREYRDHGQHPGASSQPFVIRSAYPGHQHEIERRDGAGPDETRALVNTPVVAPLLTPQRLPGVFSPDLRELRIRDLFANGRTDTNMIEFVKETSRTNNAAEVAEATSLTTGLKPESGFTLATDSAPVRTIATLIYITRQALEDASQMATYIDQLLRRFVEEREDRQLLLGDGVSPNLRGLNATGGILNLNGAYFTTTMPNKLDRLRRAKTRVRIAGRGRVSAYILNPENLEEFELMKTNATAGNNEYAALGGGPFGGPAGRTIWGTPFVESEDTPVNIAWAVDGRAAAVFDRMDAKIYITDSNRDLFERNIITILCESRLAFPVFRPETIAKVDLAAEA